jgi:hypothetical protein
MTVNNALDGRLRAALAVVAAHGIAVRRTIGDTAQGMHAAMVRAELAARYQAGMRSHVLVAITGDGYALDCSDEGVATVVVAACEAASVGTRRDGTVVIAGAVPSGVA